MSRLYSLKHVGRILAIPVFGTNRTKKFVLPVNASSYSVLRTDYPIESICSLVNFGNGNPVIQSHSILPFCSPMVLTWPTLSALHPRGPWSLATLKNGHLRPYSFKTLTPPAFHHAIVSFKNSPTCNCLVGGEGSFYLHHYLTQPFRVWLGGGIIQLRSLLDSAI